MTEINEDNIRVAAYYIWEQAGRPEGAEKECWIKAVEQLFAPKTEKKSDEKSVKKSVAKTAKASAKKTVVKKENVKPAAATTPFYGVRKK